MSFKELWPVELCALTDRAEELRTTYGTESGGSCDKILQSIHRPTITRQIRSGCDVVV